MPESVSERVCVFMFGFCNCSEFRGKTVLNNEKMVMALTLENRNISTASSFKGVFKQIYYNKRIPLAIIIMFAIGCQALMNEKCANAEYNCDIVYIWVRPILPSDANANNHVNSSCSVKLSSSLSKIPPVQVPCFVNCIRS